MKSSWRAAALATSLLALILAAVVGRDLARPTGGVEAAAPPLLYLPMTLRSPSNIFGHVTQGGTSAGGVALGLRFYNGASWSTQAEAVTDAAGHFQFLGQAPLTGTQRYQVVFENAAADDSRLAWLGTRQLTQFGADSQVEIGNFDIGAVQLAQPAHNATLGLPGTFRWSPRPSASSDNYAVRVYDTNDFNPLYVSPYVGYGDHYTLASLPAGFNYGTAYTWDVILLAADGATGVSRQARTVLFSSGIHGRVALNGAPAAGVPVELRFFNGGVWTTAASTSTDNNGQYAFTNAGSLGAGQTYYVRYENVAQTAGRLFVWSTAPLNTYSSGTALDLGSFDIGDISLSSPAGAASVNLPVTFQWIRRAAGLQDAYILEVYDPSDYTPRWLSPLLGYADHYEMLGLSELLATGTNYAWDVIITSPDGGSGVSWLARLVQFNNRGDENFRVTSAEWPFEEELPPRPLVDWLGSRRASIR